MLGHARLVARREARQLRDESAGAVPDACVVFGTASSAGSEDEDEQLAKAIAARYGPGFAWGQAGGWVSACAAQTACARAIDDPVGVAFWCVHIEEEAKAVEAANGKASVKNNKVK
jgi:hypothetical protein